MQATQKNGPHACTSIGLDAILSAIISQASHGFRSAPVIAHTVSSLPHHDMQIWARSIAGDSQHPLDYKSQPVFDAQPCMHLPNHVFARLGSSRSALTLPQAPHAA